MAPILRASSGTAAIVGIGNRIMALNAWMKTYAAKVGAIYLDYETPMSDDRHGLRADLTYDGVHPNEAGYRVMAPLVEAAIRLALSR